MAVKKAVAKPKAGTSIKKITTPVKKAATAVKAGSTIGGLFGGVTSAVKGRVTGRRHRRHGTMWYLREVQRMKAKRRYYREKLRI